MREHSINISEYGNEKSIILNNERYCNKEIVFNASSLFTAINF